MAQRVEFTKDTLTPNLEKFPQQIQKGVAQVLLFHSPRLRSYARTNAPWKDQTGNARNGLATKTGVQAPGILYLSLFHRVPYGIWLEVRWGGKYAIIMPAIRHVGPQVMVSLSGLLRRLDIR